MVWASNSCQAFLSTYRLLSVTNVWPMTMLSHEKNKIEMGGYLVQPAHGPILITRAVKLNRLPLVRIELTEPLATSLC